MGKISSYPAMTALQGPELILGDQSGSTATTTPTAVAAYMAGLTTTPVLASYARTAAEIAAGVTPTNYAYPELWVERYGADPTGTNDSGVGFRNACLVAAQKGGGVIRAYGALYMFSTWDTTSFYSTNNLALFLLPANTELAGGGQFFTKLQISQTARTGIYAGGANRTHIIGMAASTGGQYVHDLEFDWDGIVQASATDFCYDVRTCSGACTIERCYSTQAPITNAVVDSSTDSSNGNSPLGPTIVTDCWFQDSGPNMTGNSVNADCSYVYLTAPDSRAERNRIFNTAIASHNCGGIEMHCARYYATENYLFDLWPAMYLGVQDGVTISRGSVVSKNYIGYCNTGVELVDQHDGLKIVYNYFEANCDSTGAPNGYGFTDIYTPLESTTGVNSAGTQTAFEISRNTFDLTLYRQGTARATTGTAAEVISSINLSVLTGLNIDHNQFIGASPACIAIVGSVTGPGQSISIEENDFLECTDIAGTNGYIYINVASDSGWASGPILRDVFVRDNHLWRSSTYAISVCAMGLAYAGGAGPAGTITNAHFERNDCDNVLGSVLTNALTTQGQVSVNGSDQVEFALSNGATIPTGFQTISVSSGAAYTGLIMTKGLADGQRCTVVNLNSNAQTMAAFSTSNVASGTSCTIAASTSLSFVWNAATSLWYSE